MSKSVTIEEVRQMGYHDATEAMDESGSSATPDGGWDSWLINGCGGSWVIRAFGECEEENANGWSDSMVAKLKAYHEGACSAAEAFDATNE